MINRVLAAAIGLAVALSVLLGVVAGLGTTGSRLWLRKKGLK